MTDFGLEEEPQTYDPPAEERVWYRHRETGDLGYLCRYNGKQMVRLDRPNEPLPRPYSPEKWLAENIRRPYALANVAQVAFAADKKLRFVMGDHRANRVDWLSLSNDDRVDWMHTGPQNGVRKELYEAIMGVLRELSE